MNKANILISNFSEHFKITPMVKKELLKLINSVDSDILDNTDYISNNFNTGKKDITLTFKSHKNKHPKLLLSIPHCPWVFIGHYSDKLIHLTEFNKKLNSEIIKLQKQMEHNQELSLEFSKLLDTNNIK